MNEPRFIAIVIVKLFIVVLLAAAACKWGTGT